MTEDDKPVAALPEKFEVFEQNLQRDRDDYHARLSDHLADVAKANPAPKRRRSTPAVRPKDMPEPEKKKRPTAAEVKGVGGMVEKRWSGIPMWACPRCNGTTFDEAESRVHQCKQVKYANEEGLAD